MPAAYDRIQRVLNLEKRNGNFNDIGTIYWFDQAARINGNGGGAADFIRMYTNFAAGSSISQAKMQAISDRIAREVLGAVLSTGKIPPLHSIIHADITSVLEANNISLAGWGGSFFFWNVPRTDANGNPRIDPEGNNDPNDYLTIGDEIMRSTEHRELFIRTMQRTLKAVPTASGFADFTGTLAALCEARLGRIPRQCGRQSEHKWRGSRR